MRYYLVFFVIISLCSKSIAQTNGDYRSAQDGAWNTVSTWQVFNNGWVALSGASAGIYQNVIPTSASGKIAVQAGHLVSIPNGFSVTINETTIAASAQLTVATGGVLTLTNTANALVVNGTLRANDGSSITSPATTNCIFNAGSTYLHFFTTTEGVIPRGTWNSSSTLEIRGYTTFALATSTGNWGQSFGNVTWNCSNQTVTTSLAGLLKTIKGSLRILDTNTGTLQLSTTQHPTINITGDLDVEGNSTLVIGTTGATTTVNVQGDFNFNPTNNAVSQLASTGTTTVNVFGDFNMDAGAATLNLAQSTSSSGTGTLYIRGDFTLTSGTIKEGNDDSATSTGRIWFTNTGTGKKHSFTNTGTIKNRINYRLVQATDTLVLENESQLIGHTGSSLTMSAGTLAVESLAANGAIQTGSGTGAGNVRVASRTYATGATILYSGSAPQFLGNGQPTTTNVVINNPFGVSLNNTSSSTQTLASLTIIEGDFTAQNNNLTINGTTSFVIINGGSLILNSATGTRTFTFKTITLNGGNVTVNSGSSTATVTIQSNIILTSGDLTVNSGAALATLTLQGDILGTGNFYFTGSNTRLLIQGSGALSRSLPITGPTTLQFLSIARTGGTLIVPENLTVLGNVSISAGNLTTNDLVVGGDLNLASGCQLDFTGSTLELKSQFNNAYTGGFLVSDAGSRLKLTGAGSIGTLTFSAAGNIISSVTLNRPTTGNLLTLNSALTVVDSLNLYDGILRNFSGLNLSSGAVLLRNSDASLTTTAPTGGAYELVYEGTSLTSGPEALGSLQNLTSNCGGTVTISNGLALNGDLIVNSGTFTSGSNAISAVNFFNSGTFNAPSATLTLTADFVNEGTFNGNNGTVSFDGVTVITGDGATTFNTIVINGSLDPLSTLTFTGNFTNNGSYVIEDGDAVNLTGTNRQDIGGTEPTDFNDVNVTNIKTPYSVAIEGTVNLYGVLTLAAGCQFEADGMADAGVFTVKSIQDIPTTEGGTIAALDPSTTIFGSLTVERYMTGETARYNRYISSPVTGATVDQITNDYPVREVKWYDEAPSGKQTVGYTVVSGATPLVSGRGYLALPMNINETVTWDVKGGLTSGSNKDAVNFNIKHTNHGTPFSDGWNLIGNPYPANIGWGINAGWTRQNIGETITVPNSDGTDKTYTYNGADGTGTLPNGVIAMGQAFWVYANADPTPGSPTSGDEALLIVNENAKTTAQGTFYRQAGPKSKQLIITLHAPNGAERETFLKTNDSATDEFDRGFDAYQFPMEGMNIALLDKNKAPMLMHTLAGLSDDLNVPVTVEASETGEYTFTFDKQLEFLNSKELFLVDDVEQVAIALNADEPVYRFFVSDVNRQLANRFRISAKAEYSLAGEATSVTLFPNPVSDELNFSARGVRGGALEITDVNGKTVAVHNFTESATTINTTSLPKGVYIVRIVSEGKVFLRKLIKE